MESCGEDSQSQLSSLGRCSLARHLNHLCQKGAECIVKRFALVGKFLAGPYLREAPVRAILEKAWPVGGAFEVHALNYNLFLFLFDRQSDMLSVVNGCPWNIMDHHLVLKVWPEEVSFLNLSFSETVLHVLCQLPNALLTEENAAHIATSFTKANQIEIMQQDEDSKDGIVSFEIVSPVYAPLRKGFNLLAHDGNTSWKPFTYLALGEFCYKCGRIGHSMRGCAWIKGGDHTQFYPMSLRAPPQNTSRSYCYKLNDLQSDAKWRNLIYAFDDNEEILCFKGQHLRGSSLRRQMGNFRARNEIRALVHSWVHEVGPGMWQFDPSPGITFDSYLLESAFVYADGEGESPILGRVMESNADATLILNRIRDVARQKHLLENEESAEAIRNFPINDPSAAYQSSHPTLKLKKSNSPFTPAPSVVSLADP